MNGQYTKDPKVVGLVFHLSLKIIEICFYLVEISIKGSLNTLEDSL